MQPGPLSVSSLNEYVRRSLAGDPMLQGIALRGEISNFKRHTSGHLYFSLKDETSRIACVMFRQYAQMLRFAPGDGMSVVLSGSVGLYTATGSYQFYGEAMAADGAGALYERFLRLKEKLQKEGLFDASRKRALPLLPRGVGIVTSGGGAVFHDIVTVTRRRFPGMPLILRASQVQGAGAAEDLAAGLDALARLDEVDVIIIGRGGGSLEDLWAFNEETLVRAVASCPKPVVSAVGHETDVTLSDFAADVRAATPSAAAEIAVPSAAELDARVSGLLRGLDTQAAQALERKQSHLNGLLTRLGLADPASRLALASARQTLLSSRLNAAANSVFASIQAGAKAAMERFALAGPQQTLNRGYVIALKDGRPVKSAGVASGVMDLMFHDGTVRVNTLETYMQAKEDSDGEKA